MSLATDMYAQAAFPAWLALYGETVTYNEPGKSGVSVTAKVGPAGIDEEAVDEGRDAVLTRAVTVSTDDLSEVRLDASFTIDGDVWEVASIVDKRAYKIKANVTRPEVVERSQEGYRGDS
jgi:hypothetical protein